MKSLHFTRAKKSLCGRVLRRLLGEETGAVAMEYIVIALLVAAAVVGLVMVFGGNIRNMFDKANRTMTAKDVKTIDQIGDDTNTERDALDKKNDLASQGGNKIGGNFSEDRAKTTSGGGSGS